MVRARPLPPSCAPIWAACLRKRWCVAVVVVVVVVVWLLMLLWRLVVELPGRSYYPQDCTGSHSAMGKQSRRHDNAQSVLARMLCFCHFHT